MTVGFPRLRNLPLSGVAPIPTGEPWQRLTDTAKRALARHGAFGNPWHLELTKAQVPGDDRGPRMVFQARGSGGIRLCVKVYHKPERCRAQVAGLRSFSGYGVHVAQPVFHDDDLGVLCLRWFDGPMVADRMGGPDHSVQASRLLAFSDRMGRAAEIGRRHVDLTGKIQQLRAMHEACGACVDALNMEDMSATLALVEARLREVFGEPLPHAHVHYDFSPSNVIDTRDGFVVIDVPHPAVDLPQEQTARLLFHLEMARFSALSEARAWPENDFDAPTRERLHDDPLLQAVYVAHLFQRELGIMAREPGGAYGKHIATLRRAAMEIR